jgi:hypothetical protein
MLRAFLLASPLLVLGLVSCGDSASSFDDSTLPGGSSTGATSGDGSGATSSQGGSSSSGGTKANAGSENSSAGTENGSAGAQNGNGGAGTGNAGTGNDAGTNNGGSTSGGGKGGTGNGGGAQAGTGNGGSGQAGTTNGGSAGSAGGGTAGSAGTAGTGGAAGSAGTGGTGPACPDKIFGSYDIVNTQGSCNGFNENASQSITGTDVACAAHFVSIAPNPGGSGAINGGAQLDENGNFTGATLYLGKNQRTPCSGKWDPVEERMTVKCGSGGEACSVILDLK